MLTHHDSTHHLLRLHDRHSDGARLVYLSIWSHRDFLHVSFRVYTCCREGMDLMRPSKEAGNDRNGDVSGIVAKDAPQLQKMLRQQ